MGTAYFKKNVKSVIKHMYKNQFGELTYTN